MKPSVKSALPTAAILFSTVLSILFFIQVRLYERNSTYLRNQRPGVAESVFMADGSLVHVVGIPDPPVDGLPAWRREVYDEKLSVKPLSVDATNAFLKEYQGKRMSITPVSERKTEWWSLDVWKAPSALLWWNGPEGQFDIYDSHTRLRSASIGPDGVVTRAPARPQERFRLASDPIVFNHDYLLITDDGVLRLNPEPKNLGIERLFDGKVKGWGIRQEQEGKVARMYVISGGALWQLDLKDPPVRKVPLSDELSQAILAADESSIVPLENGRFSIETDYRAGNWRRKTLFLLDSDGSVLRRVELDRDELNARIRHGIPSKSGMTTLTIVILPWLRWERTTADFIQYAVLSLVLTGLVAWHQARTGRRGWRAFAWSAFTFVTGLAGAAAYVIAHWDKRTEACPGCGKRRPIAQDTCPHCNIPWPKPAKSGFEVLEAR